MKCSRRKARDDIQKLSCLRHNPTIFRASVEGCFFAFVLFYLLARMCESTVLFRKFCSSTSNDVIDLQEIERVDKRKSKQGMEKERSNC